MKAASLPDEGLGEEATAGADPRWAGDAER
jgi:hypothetical protein